MQSGRGKGCTSSFTERASDKNYNRDISCKEENASDQDKALENYK